MIFLFISINVKYINKYTNTETALYLCNKLLWSHGINLSTCYCLHKLWACCIDYHE